MSRLQNVKIASMALSWNLPHGKDFAPWLQKVKELGFDGISGFAWWGWEEFRGKGEAFARQIRDSGLQLASVDVQYNTDFRFYDEVIEFLKATGCKHLICLSAPKDQADAPREIEWLNRLGERCTREGIFACYHPRTIGVGSRFSEADSILRQTNPQFVHAVLETGHSTKDFKDLPVEQRSLTWLNTHASRIKLIEAKDWSDAHDLNTPLGEGHAPLPAIINRLAELNYDGWVVIEQNSNDGLLPGRSYEDCARTSLGFLRKLIGNAQ